MTEARLSVENLANLNITIYGFHDDEGYTTGGLVSPGMTRIARKLVNELINKVADYFFSFNALLEDFLGYRLYFSEFLLRSLVEEKNFGILPKGVLLIPGRFKDSSNFVLSLEYERGLIDPYQGIKQMDELCDYTHQIMEAMLRPEISIEKRNVILEKFSRRNAKKLYGIFLDKEWERKYSGKDNDKTFDQMSTETEIILTGLLRPDYGVFPPGIEVIEYSLKEIIPAQRKKDYMYLEEMPTIASVKSIIQKLFPFATNLFKPLKESTGNFIEIMVLDVFSQYFLEIIDSFDKPRPPFFLNSLLAEETAVFTDAFNSFHRQLEEYMKSGKKQTLQKHGEDIWQAVVNSGVGVQQSLLRKIYDAFLEHVKIERGNETEEILPTWELKKHLNFTEIGKRTIKHLEKRALSYLAMSCEHDLIESYINSFEKEILSRQDDPVKIISHPYLQKFRGFVENEIKKKYIQKAITEKLNETVIEDQFQKDLLAYSKKFLGNITLTLDDLITFTSTFMERRVTDPIGKERFSKIHEIVKTYSGEIKFLLDYVVRHSILNPFLKHSKQVLSEPGFEDHFIQLLIEFLESRLIMPLHWKVLVEEWLTKFEIKAEGKTWSMHDQIMEFQKYLQQLKQNEMQPERFLKHLNDHVFKKYQEDQAEVEIALIRLFRELFRQSMEISQMIPEFLLNNFTDFVKNNQVKISSKIPKEFLFEKEMEFKDFIEKLEILSFPQLSCYPRLIILQNKKIPELQYKLSFEYSGEQMERTRITASSNYELIKSKIRFKY
ncbi:MAG: hypothetical protein ACTSRW_13430 [Candidatus Helarchaeota archaeon]